MDVDDAVGELVDEVCRNLRKEACENDEVASANGLNHESWFVEELLSCDDGSGYSQFLCTYERISVAAAEKALEIEDIEFEEIPPCQIG